MNLHLSPCLVFWIRSTLTITYYIIHYFALSLSLSIYSNMYTNLHLSPCLVFWIRYTLTITYYIIHTFALSLSLSVTTCVNEPSSLTLFGILNKVYTYDHLLHHILPLSLSRPCMLSTCLCFTRNVFVFD